MRQIRTMTTRVIERADEASVMALANDIAARARAGDAILLSGPLGAGKTSFARAFIRARAGDPDLPVPSPSFTLIQSYDLDPPVAHVDLWRLADPGEASELGLDQAYAGIVLIEWPDRLGGDEPEDALRIALAWDENDPDATLRRVTLDGPARLIGDEA